MKDADFIMILYCSNIYERSLVDVPFYRPGKKIDGPHHDHEDLYTPGIWDTRTVIRGMYYPFIGISCIGNLQGEPELIWQGQGMESTRQSNLLRYGQGLIKEMLSKFPEISEKTEEELPLVEVKEDKNEKIKMLLEELENN